MSSKFVLRFRGKHIFNPGNLGAILALTLLPGGWVSPGQWGHEAALAGWFFVLGAVVVQRARRADISWTFLAFFLGGVALRVLLLGQRWAVWTHQLESGALLLFAFFMISDPMTIPNHRRGRLLYAGLVAAVALVWQYVFFWKNGLLWALFLLSPTVPLWDIVWPAPRFHWTPQGDRHEPPSRAQAPQPPEPIPLRPLAAPSARGSARPAGRPDDRNGGSPRRGALPDPAA
jgi:Na+-transporting NADH:ubiquinone oxidoreductase subunit NqrB